MISGEWTAKHLHRGVSYATFSIGTGTGLIFGRTPSGSGDARYLRMYPSLQHLEPTNQVTLPGQLRSWAKTDGAHDEQGHPPRPGPAGAAFVEPEQHWAKWRPVESPGPTGWPSTSSNR